MVEAGPCIEISRKLDRDFGELSFVRGAPPVRIAERRRCPRQLWENYLERDMNTLEKAVLDFVNLPHPAACYESQDNESVRDGMSRLKAGRRQVGALDGKVGGRYDFQSASARAIGRQDRLLQKATGATVVEQ